MHLTNTDFQQEISFLTEQLRKRYDEQDPKEHVLESDVASAMILLNLISYKNVADIFLGCAAMNLINAYVNQESSHLNYQFKRHLINLIKGVEDVRQPDLILVDYDQHAGGCLMISIMGFQFTYKSIRYSEAIQLLQFHERIEWDGLRKQPYSKTIYEFALQNDHISNLTLAKCNLKEKLAREMDLYNSGSYKFKNGKLVKVTNFNVAHDIEDKELKNYFRKKLSDCRNRPVILSGVYVKTWPQHVTFTTILPYIESVKAITVCDHINILRSDLERVYPLENLEVGKRYYIIGYCNVYGKGRMGVKLLLEKGFCPIVDLTEFNKIPKDIISRCYRFSIEEYLSAYQKELKM